MENITNYKRLTSLDLLVNGIHNKYPYRLNEQARYTQHQLKLYYKSNYCKTDNESNDEDMVKGGNETISIGFI